MTASPLTWALVALLVPLFVAALLLVAAPLRRAGKPAGLISVGAAAVAFGAALQLLLEPSTLPLEKTLRWLPVGGQTLAEMGLRIDGTSSLMLLVVTSVALAVQVFSLGYMAAEPKPAFGRYFAYHSLFIFAMNLLVLAPNLLQLFIGWELVGLTSYLLIGFYYEKPQAAQAAVKAFWMTKFADMGLLVGLLVLFFETGGFSWSAPLDGQQANWIALCLFIAVMGKSAQFPLHIWLPNAMEGPTPVSALLHAATMVAAGVYLIVRANPIFEGAEATLRFMAYLGSFTAVFAAVIALIQTDIKKVLAYSTCSQLGYMIAALGAGSTLAGFFHLTTHAFFKALLFLAAGSVIHAVHSNELSDMGGLAKKMRISTLAFVVGALALSGIPLFSGFFSKDLILEAVYQQGLMLPLGCLLVGAFLTPFYMGRVVFLAFFGKPSPKAKDAHEGGLSMTLPLIGLSLLALTAGFFGKPFGEKLGQDYHFHIGTVGIIATLAALSGIALSWAVYLKRSLPLSAFSALAPIAALARSGAVDRLFENGYRRALLSLAALVGWVDRYVIDGLINWSAWVTIRGGERLRKLQTGNVLDYVAVVFAGTLLLIAWGTLR